jgi:hypothetical protein
MTEFIAELHHMLHSLRGVVHVLLVLIAVLLLLKLFRDMFHPDKP